MEKGKEKELGDGAAADGTPYQLSVDGINLIHSKDTPDTDGLKGVGEGVNQGGGPWRLANCVLPWSTHEGCPLCGERGSITHPFERCGAVQPFTTSPLRLLLQPPHPPEERGSAGPMGNMEDNLLGDPQ